MNVRNFLTAAAAGLVCAQSLAANPPAVPAKPAAKPAAAAPAGPWTKVPALPTTCYSGTDGWYDRYGAALDAVQQDHYRQNDINRELQQKANKALNENPMAMAQAMQQAMMNGPQGAQKFMERITQQGQQAGADIQADTARSKQLEDEGKALVKQYQAALGKSLGPANARWDALKKKRGYDAGAYGPSETGEPDWVYAEWVGILQDRDRGYAANGAVWYAATGPIHAYMKRYKDYLAGEYMAYRKQVVDQPALDNFKMLNVPATTYRTVADYEAAELYLRRAYDMFSPRMDHSYCQPTGCE